MYSRILALSLLSALLLAGTACRKPASPAQSQSTLADSHIQARIHWLGKDRIKADTNSAYLMTVWNLPESKRVQDELVGKLALAPWSARLGPTNLDEEAFAAATNLFQPIVDDLFSRECFAEIRGGTNASRELALAVRLDSERSALWQTNLAQTLQLLVGGLIVPEGTNGGWVLRQTNGSGLIQFRRSGDWTLVGMAPNTNAALNEMLARTLANQLPGESRATNWLEAELDLHALCPALANDLALPFSPPRVALSVYGDGEYVRTRGDLYFAKPLDLPLEKWNPPTNLIREPLISFNALRGFRPWLSGIKWIQDLHVPQVPNQLFGWSISISHVHTFAAMPLPDAAKFVDENGRRFEGEINAWLTNHALGAVEFSPPNHGLGWVPVPLMTPTVQALPGVGGGVLFGRLASTLPPPGKMAPPDLLNRLNQQNLVYYGWEITQPRIEDWLFLSQSARVAFKKAQLPQTSSAFAFFKAAAPKLGNAATEVVQSGPSTLSLTRKSHIGVTAFELQLFFDWLESPGFPVGLHTFLGEPSPEIRWNSKTHKFQKVTNAPPVKP